MAYSCTRGSSHRTFHRGGCQALEQDPQEKGQPYWCSTGACPMLSDTCFMLPCVGSGVGFNDPPVSRILCDSRSSCQGHGTSVRWLEVNAMIGVQDELWKFDNRYFPYFSQGSAQFCKIQWGKETAVGVLQTLLAASLPHREPQHFVCGLKKFHPHKSCEEARGVNRPLLHIV